MQADESSTQKARSEAETSTNPFPFHSVNLCEYLWKVGFQGGAYSDVELHVLSRRYNLHRIILSRSPYLQHLMEVTPPQQPLWVRVDDEAVTEEAIAIVLGHLYAAYSYSMVNLSNARDVLIASTFFGLPDLAAYAYDICKQSINADTISAWVEWCEVQSGRGQRVYGNGGSNGYQNGQSGSPVIFGNFMSDSGNGSASESANRHDYASKLRHDVCEYLIRDLIPELSSTSTTTPYSPNEDSRFLAIFSTLPFELFKSCIEEKALPLGSDQERFAFAKKAVAARKKMVAASGTTDTQVVENVVLQFTGGKGSNVHVTRKVKTAGRPLWKVVKE